MIGKAHAGFAPSLTGDEPIVLLIVGSGARLGDDVEHSLADSLHVVTINPDKHKATLIGIPRDSWVEIPGGGTSKINASIVQGGPDLLIQTVESISGLTIDYYALTTFWGMTQLYDNLGGLTMDVPFPMQDSFSGSDFEPGVQTLDGKQVLAFSRDRHSLSEGDFARQENGGRVLVASLARVPQGVPGGSERVVHVGRVGHAERARRRCRSTRSSRSRTRARTSTRRA